MLSLGNADILSHIDRNTTKLRFCFDQDVERQHHQIWFQNAKVIASYLRYYNWVYMMIILQQRLRQPWKLWCTNFWCISVLVKEEMQHLTNMSERFQFIWYFMSFEISIYLYFMSFEISFHLRFFVIWHFVSLDILCHFAFCVISFFVSFDVLCHLTFLFIWANKCPQVGRVYQKTSLIFSISWCKKNFLDLCRGKNWLQETNVLSTTKIRQEIKWG